jgi:hypothetical protein
MAAKALLARTIRESSDCTQMPSSIALKRVSQESGDASPPVCEFGSAGSDDSSFMVVFYRACQPPSLRVSSIRFLLSNCLASDLRWDRQPVKLYETTALAREIGIFPQSLGYIPQSPSKTKNPVSPPPDVTFTIGESERRTIAPSTAPRKMKGLVSTNISCKPHSRSLKIGNSSVCNSIRS